MFARRIILSGAAALLGAAAFGQSAPAPAAPLVYYAGQGARLTMDRDRQGGNPFASALVEVLKQPGLKLGKFGDALATANYRHSDGWQNAQLPKRVGNPDWRVTGAAAGERRIALVLINSDYSGSELLSLPGAAFDAKRVPKALEAAGFAVTLVHNATPEAAREALARFTEASAAADAAAVYVGGHGVQHGRKVYAIMPSYPQRSSRFLATHAISLDDVAAKLKARAANLILYASCRDDPFDD